MEASKMESTASLQERKDREREADEARDQTGDVPAQSGANDQNRTDADPGDQVDRPA